MNSLRIWKKSDVLPFLAVVLLPWQARYIFAQHILNGGEYEYGAISAYASSFLVMAAVIYFIRTNKKKVSEFFSWRLVLLFIWIIAGVIFAIAQLIAAWYIVLFVLAMGYGIIAFVWPTRKTMLAFISAGLIQAVFAWYQFIVQKVEASTVFGVAEHLPEVLGQSVVIVLGGRFLRAYGGLPHPNILAGVLVLSCAMAIYLFMYHKRSRTNMTEVKWVVYMAVIAFLFSGIMITFSRSALVAFVAVCLSWFIIAILKKKEYLYIRLAQVLSICLALFFTFNVIADNVWLQRFGLSPVSEQIVLDDRSSNERVSQYADATAMINTESLLFGIGVNNFIPRYEASKPGLDLYQYQPVHNSYIMIILELGLIGFVVLLWFGLRGMKNYLALFTIGLPFLVIAFFDHYLWTSFVGVAMVWLVYGITLKKTSPH